MAVFKPALLPSPHMQRDCSVGFLEAMLAKVAAIAAGTYCSPRVTNLVFQYLSSAINMKELYKCALLWSDRLAINAICMQGCTVLYKGRAGGSKHNDMSCCSLCAVREPQNKCVRALALTLHVTHHFVLPCLQACLKPLGLHPCQCGFPHHVLQC